MTQIFHHSTNALTNITIYGAVFIIVALLWVAVELNRSSWNTGQWLERQQPVQFSHKHHVGDDGIDCRYCHTSVENSSFAGIPPTKTCMSCHSQIWADSPALAAVRNSFRDDQSIQWTRVHNLPGFVYFDHSIHVHKGIGCSPCHGRVDMMPLTWRENTLYMDWCLECHREPERFVRPREYVFNMDYSPPADQIALGQKLVKEYKIQNLTSSSPCHRKRQSKCQERECSKTPLI